MLTGCGRQRAQYIQCTYTKAAVYPHRQFYACFDLISNRDVMDDRDSDFRVKTVAMTRERVSLTGRDVKTRWSRCYAIGSGLACFGKTFIWSRLLPYTFSMLAPSNLLRDDEQKSAKPLLFTQILHIRIYNLKQIIDPRLTFSLAIIKMITSYLIITCF